MGDHSAIEWTDASWNPITGCSKVSPGCAHCYAERVAIRLWPSQYPPVTTGRYVAKAEGVAPIASGLLTRPRVFTDVQCHEDRLDQPLRWKRPRTIFVNSMSDLFHEDVPDAFIDRVFAVMALAPQHTFQVLTKRAARMRAYMTAIDLEHRIGAAAFELAEASGIDWDVSWRKRDFGNAHEPDRWPLKNVWLGVSVENQRFADARIPLLLQTPAAVRFLSCEPLLEGLDLAKHRPGANRLWIIVGGESGPSSRPCEVRWIRSIVRQCQESDTPVFVKQLGAWPIVPAGRQQHWEWGGAIGREARFEATDPAYPSSEPWRVVLRDRKGGDMAEWPEDLRVRQMPAVEARG